jgi:hypothetical protein
MDAIVRARNLTYAMDPSEFPHSARRNQLIGQQRYEGALATRMITQLEPYVIPEVVPEAEALLRDPTQ